ncbi:hypothetical protein HKO46_08630 [Streptococcus equi subsp. zooepidemicus]|uniref:Uncharacterized protein n=1 Tax=Streptococcus equi subsp. zooepidemicus (strain H70) TaxID=553483 RepID=C0MDQ9_STRS7|nr:hypothetical protein [Streptococcus equi]AEJ24704.1 conserved hypothetical protein [Streptococcus equi subsp. zooepidemicus ATCC 35246]AIA68850.1 hypothetical protein Q426_06860 [Streptococcus equi subsp. zooepidemicus CY]KIS12831.1 hypothetical protein AT51_00024 [Streptococcus equi subsp. zooepidemicus Sz57]HEL1016238.1 hypothetical protein [Streptococcus equi subsp. ruminatorum]MBR7684306.1 hypothetical protein [Streptococcus equi subsp. zooepidemicus]
MALVGQGVIRAADYGGWSEETGYYTSVKAFNASHQAVGSHTPKALLGVPRHTGRKEQSNLLLRAHGWTTWVGVRHYTRARMTSYLSENNVYTDSGRVWGVGGTEAISPWYNTLHPENGAMARTYYGR